MHLLKWLVVSALGFGAMLHAYDRRPRLEPQSVWAHGRMAVGTSGPAGELKRGLVVDATVRVLPAGKETEAILDAMSKARPGKNLGLELQLRPKLVRVDLGEARIDGGALASGRLPEPGRGEVVAGASLAAAPGGRVEVAGEPLSVVGVLRPGLHLFADSYLTPPSKEADAFFPSKNPDVKPATLVGLTRAERGDPGLAREIGRAVRGGPLWHEPPLRMGRSAYYEYVAGLFVLLAAGSGFLIGVYRALVSKAVPAWLRAPLEELAARPRLVWGVHLAYFGMVAFTAVLVYELSEVQAAFLSLVRGQLSGEDGRGILAAAGSAYASRNVAWAALVTFLVNFLVGSLACITLPSLIVPGAGVFLAAFRALLWGWLLGPTTVETAGVILPHSWTMLLEGEAYVLATVFALLIPVRIASPRLGGTPLSRFGRAAVLNLQGAVWVAAVLAVAAVYEAAEVIAMMNMAG